jgi:glycosyltransferase 2 family protein
MRRPVMGEPRLSGHDGAIALAAAALVASATAARQHRVTTTEVAVFRRFNLATDVIAAPSWIVMQGGSLGAVAVGAGVTAVRRGRRPGLIVLAVGTGVWAGVKLIKPFVGRHRPAAYVADVNVRGAPQTGLGYPSGHAAVATMLALATTRSRRSRALALASAAAVGCARMYSGAHLPLDVVGGLAAGGLAGLLSQRSIDNS